MATKSLKSLALLWTIAFTAILASSMEAARPSPQQCWQSLTQISGCAADISRAAATMQPSMKIGQDCCNALVQLDDNCWSMMFPMNPRVPDLLKGICGGGGGGGVVMAPTYPAAPHPAAASSGIDINATVLAGDAHEGAAPDPHN